MILKMEKDSDGLKSIIRLSGRLRSEHLEAPGAHWKAIGSRLHGIELFHCPAYVREWMLREKDGDR